ELAKPSSDLPSGSEVAGAGEQPDPPVPERDQVPGRRLDAARVVAEDGGPAQALGKVSVDRDEGDRERAELLERRAVRFPGEGQDQAVERALAEVADVLGVSIGVAF